MKCPSKGYRDATQMGMIRWFIFGRRSSGYFDVRTLDGVKISASASCKKFTIVQKASACLVERRAAFPPVA